MSLRPLSDHEEELPQMSRYAQLLLSRYETWIENARKAEVELIKDSSSLGYREIQLRKAGIAGNHKNAKDVAKLFKQEMGLDIARYL